MLCAVVLCCAGKLDICNYKMSIKMDRLVFVFERAREGKGGRKEPFEGCIMDTFSSDSVLFGCMHSIYRK